MTASDRAAELRGIPRESRELGLDKPILSNFSTESHDSVSKCAALLGQVKYTYQKQGPAYEKLLTEYKQRYGMDPASPSMQRQTRFETASCGLPTTRAQPATVFHLM